MLGSGVLNRRRAIVLAFLGAAVASVALMTRLRIKADVSVAHEDGDLARRTEVMNQRFGEQDGLTIVVEADAIFTPDRLSRLRDLAERIADIEGVAQVLHPGSATRLQITDTSFDLRPIMPDGPLSATDVQRARRLLMSSALYAGRLVSRDGASALILVTLESTADPPAVVEAVGEQLRGWLGTEELYLFGGAELTRTIADLVEQDMSTMPTRMRPWSAP